MKKKVTNPKRKPINSKPKASLGQLAVVGVTFTAGGRGEPGTWSLDSPAVVLPYPATSQCSVEYRLNDPKCTPDWSLTHIAICKKYPIRTDWMEVSSASPLNFEGLTVSQVFSADGKSITVSLGGGVTEDAVGTVFGVLLGIGRDGYESHMCHDPQIILEREPTIIDHVAAPRRPRKSR